MRLQISDLKLRLRASDNQTSSRSDLSAEDVWRTYVLLSRVEAAFRAMKSPLCERPIFHHLERRVKTHIFLCVLTYHLLVCMERAFLDQGIHTFWETLPQPTVHSPGGHRTTADHRWPSLHHPPRYTARANPP